MESKFNFKSQICTTKEQSKRLLALGLKKETADMWRYKDAYGWRLSPVEEIWNEAYLEYGTPAWSLLRLLSMFPTDTPKIYGTVGVAIICIRFNNGINFFPYEGDIYEGVVKGIEWSIKEGYFNKEYLERKE